MESSSLARSGPLERLVGSARALAASADPDVEPLPFAIRVRSGDDVEPDEVDAAALRRRMGGLLRRLAERLERELPERLEAAHTAWDQVDTLAVLDRPIRAEARDILRLAHALRASEQPSRSAMGLEAALTLEATLGLCDLVERRLAALVRLRLAGPDPALLPDGRPFLDVAAALAAAALEWS